MQYQVEAIQAEVTKQQQETEADLAKAEPALQAANAALNTLNRVCMCVCVLYVCTCIKACVLSTVLNRSQTQNPSVLFLCAELICLVFSRIIVYLCVCIVEPNRVADISESSCHRI